MKEALKQKKSGRVAAAIVCLLLVAAAAAYAALCTHASRTFHPHYELNGLDVGGLTAEQAQKLLEETLPARQVTLLSEDGGTLAALTLAELGYPAERFAGTAAAQLAEQNAGPFLMRGAQRLSAGNGQESVDVWSWPERDEAIYAATAARLAEELSAVPVNGACTLGDDVLIITRPRDGWTLSAAGLDCLRDTALYQGGRTVTVTRETAAAEDFDLQTACAALLGEMVNAEYDKETDSVKPDRTGASFDVAEAQRLLAAAAPGETVRVGAQVTQPDITKEALESVLFRDVLGEYCSQVTGQDGRVTNVRLSAAAINGYVLDPGETFSYNDVVGKRTAARGYQAGPAYVNGKTVMEIGGGICQTSSTLYLACLLANMEIVTRSPHGYVPAYVPWGMDSAVSWGGPEYRFSNNSAYPVKIVTEFDGEFLTVQLLGSNLDGKWSEMSFEVLSTTDWTTEYVEDPTMEPGSEGVVMAEPYTGAKVRTTHTIYDADGNVLDSHVEAISNYKMRNQIIHVPVGEIPVPADS